MPFWRAIALGQSHSHPGDPDARSYPAEGPPAGSHPPISAWHPLMPGACAPPLRRAATRRAIRITRQAPAEHGRHRAHASPAPATLEAKSTDEVIVEASALARHGPGWWQAIWQEAEDPPISKANTAASAAQADDRLTPAPPMMSADGGKRLPRGRRQPGDERQRSIELLE